MAGNQLYRIHDWERLYENNRTRDLVNAQWFPCPNSTGVKYCELLEHKRGASHYGAWCALLGLASRSPKRGIFSDNSGNPYSIVQISRVTHIPLKTLEESIVRLVALGWLEVGESRTHPAPIPQESRTHPAGIPHPSRTHPAPIPQEGAPRASRVGREGKGREEEEKRTHTVSRFESSVVEEPELPTACVPPKPNGLNEFTPDCERFASAYPLPVNDLAQQYFCQIVKNCVLQATLFKNLDGWKASDQWKRGIGIKAAKTWLSEGDWKVCPKSPTELAAELNPPAPPPPDWESPAPPPARTIADVLEDIRLQQKFKAERPKLAAVAQERLLELESELRWLECGEPQPANARTGTLVHE